MPSRPHAALSPPVQKPALETPPTLPARISLPLLYKGEFLKLFDEASQYPGIIRLDGALFRLFQVNDPALIQEVLRDKQKRYRKGRLMRRLSAVTGDGLLINDGDVWRRHRRLANPAFSAKKLDGYVACMMDSADILLERWHQRDPAEPIDLLQEMSEVTLISLLRTIFGISFDEKYAEVSGVIHVMLEEVVRRGRSFFPLPLSFPTPANLRFRKKIAESHRILEEIITTRREAIAGNEDPVDLLGQWLLQAESEQAEDAHFSPQEMRDELMTMLIAGHHSLAIALAWSLYEIARHPDVQAALQAEVDAWTCLPEDHKGWEQLTYTQGVFLEALRFYPQPPLLLRDSLQDHALGSYAIREGDQLLLNVLAVHQNPACWPQPASFQPERYQTFSADKMLQNHYLSFGGGSRSCIGRRFAIAEGCLLLARIVREFQIELCAEEPVTPRFSAMIVPERPLPLQVVPRR